MSTMYSVFLILIGFFTAICIWGVNLKIKRHLKVMRWGSLAGIFVLLGMFLYSIDYIKGVNYSPLLVVGLSIGTTIVWVLACTLIVGLLIILSVGIYWVVITLRQTSLEEFCGNIKKDFVCSFEKIKAWIEGEE